MSTAVKKNIKLGVTAILSVAFWAISIIVMAVFRSRASWADEISSGAYVGFWNSPTKFAILMPLFFTLAIAFSLMLIGCILGGNAKKRLSDRINGIKVAPRMVICSLLGVLTVGIIFLEYLYISMIPVVWKGQYQSYWNTGSLSRGLLLLTVLFIITVCAFVIFIRPILKKK